MREEFTSGEKFVVKLSKEKMDEIYGSEKSTAKAVEGTGVVWYLAHWLDESQTKECRNDIPYCVTNFRDIEDYIYGEFKKKGLPVKRIELLSREVVDSDFGNEPNDSVNHPSHYGGDSTYEAIKVIEAWDLGFCLGNVIKYVSRAENKGNKLEDLKKAQWYLEREISKLEK